MQLLESVPAEPPKMGEVNFDALYERAFPLFARFAGKMNASFDDAKDIFQDAMVIYYEKTSDASFSIKVSPESYVVGIARHLWIRKFNRDKKQVALSGDEEDFSIPPDYFPDKQEAKLLAFLERAGEKCMDLLQRFYFERMPLKAIASSLGFRTEHSAAVQKYKCIGKVREAIRSKALRYEDFHS